MAAPTLEPAPPLLRNLLIPLSLVIVFALIYLVGLRLVVAVIAISPLVLLYLLAPRWAVASATAFDRDALRLRASGRSAELGARFRRSLGMRLFAPPMASAERLAEILRETGDPARARREFQRALRAAGSAPTLSMMVGLAHSAYAAGEHGHAIAAYRRVLRVDAGLPRVRIRLAHALLRRDEKGDVEDAIELLDVIPDAKADRTELALLRAYADARRGKRDEPRATITALDAEKTHPELLAEIDDVLRSST